MVKIDKWIEDERTGEEFLVEFSAEIENDGIGAYEFWGQKCVDKGTDYIGEITFDETGLTAEQVSQVEALVEQRDSLVDAFNDSLS